MGLKYRADVDVLRALAVSLVLAHHYGWLSGGFVGVDVFFVLSAFLITSLLRESPQPSLRVFYTRRVRRLQPALFATLLLTMALAPLLPDVRVADTSAAALAALLAVSNHYFAASLDYFAPAVPSLLLHTWSLSVEEQFYLVWPLALRVLRRRPHLILALSLLLLLAAQLALPHYPRYVFFAAPFRAFEFLAGAYASFYAPPRLSPLLTELLFALGLACILLPAVTYTRATPFPALAAVPPLAGAVAVLLAAPRSAVSARLQRAPVLYVGRISYALYLLHWPLLLAARSALGVQSLSALESVLLAAVTLACAAALHRFVETPLRAPPSATAAEAALSWRWLLPPAAIAVAALHGVLWRPCGCALAAGASSSSSPSPSLLRALTDAVSTQAAANGSSDAFGERAFGTWSGASRKHSLVIGDSHAAVLAPLFGYLAWRYGALVRLRAAPACSPLLGVRKVRVSVGVGQSSVSVPQLRECESIVADWLARVDEPSVERVFLVSRWSTSVQRGEYFTRGALAEYRFQEARGGGAVPSLNESRALFERSLRRTVRHVQKLGKQVVLVGEPPDLGRGTFTCKRWLRQMRRQQARRFEEWRRLEREQPAACVGAPRALAMQRLRYVNAVLRAVGEETGAKTVLLSEYLCDNGRWDGTYCRVLSEGELLYRDSDHVSEAGAVYLATKWQSDRRRWFPHDWRVA